MAVREILDKRMIDLDITAKTKDEAIRHLAELLIEAGYIQDLEGYVKDMYLRESEGITGIGNHVAIPREKSDCVGHVGLVVGHTGDMAEWESYDEQPSDLFFLLVVLAGSEGARGYLRLIAELAGELGNDSIITKLQAAESYDELLEAFA